MWRRDKGEESEIWRLRVALNRGGVMTADQGRRQGELCEAQAGQWGSWRDSCGRC